MRYIRAGNKEVLRRVMVAVRDSSWKTVPVRISNEAVTVGTDEFHIAFDARHVDENVDFAWHGTMEGRADGTIRWTMSGEPLRTFWRNRIGFCVLHPIEECAGQACEVEHVDSSRERSLFPDLIAPHQPFVQVRALSHAVSPDIHARVQMTGDVFETEDQRNWSDASFKTYSTPLSLPYPVLVKPGDRVQQSVELTITGRPQYVPLGNGPVSMAIDRIKRYAMPAIGGPQQFGFVDLNRNHDMVRWCIDPRVHADDELTMVENLAGQAPMVVSARAIYGERPMHVSVKVPPMRNTSGWVAISIGELARAGVAAIGFDVPAPVLNDIKENKPAYLFGCHSDAPLRCGALALETGAWVANFTDGHQAVLFDGQALELLPFELRRVSWVSPR